MSLQSELRTWADTTLAPMRHSLYLWMWTAMLIANSGGMVQNVGASWLMTSIAPSPDMVALVQTAQTLPFAFFSLFAGAFADLMDRRKVMLAAQVFTCAASAALAILGAFNWITPWTLLFFTFLVGTGGAFQGPSYQASVADLVPRAVLPAGVALNSLGFNVARSLGPAIGGAIVAIGGSPLAFAVNALAYVGSITVLANWKKPPRVSHLPPEPLGRAILTGVRYVALSRHLLSVILRILMFSVIGGALQALTPVIARASGGGPLVFGLFLTFFGIGAMIGALSTARLRTAFSVERIATVGALMQALGTVLVSLNAGLWLSLPAMMMCGGAWVTVLSTANIAMQTASPRWVVGRALSCYQVAFLAGFALGAAAWGVIARAFGWQTALMASAMLVTASQLLTRFLPLPNIKDEDYGPPSVAFGPEPAAEVDPRSGPVLILVEYEVDPAKAHEFSHAIHALGRMRRRDGVYGWTVAQDIENPRVWVERFHRTSWADRLRGLERPTAADDSVRAHVAALHVGEARPKVRWFLERQPGAGLAPTREQEPPVIAPDPALTP